MVACGADNIANDLMVSLNAGKDFTLPDIDMDRTEYQLPSEVGDIYEDITKLSNDDLTTGLISGAGTFDVFMRAVNAHLAEQYKQNRITGDQYAKAYIAMVEGAMSNSVQFLMNQDQAYWQAVNAQIQAQTAKVNLVTARVQLEATKVLLHRNKLDALTAEAEYALTKMKLAGESAAYCISEFNLNTMLPKQALQLDKQLEQLTEQISGMVVQKNTAQYQLTNILPIQKTLTQEQLEAARGQTLNTRTDGVAITGSIGKQRDLYDQQITSYKRDAENKTLKVFTDAWITMKTIDEGLAPPTQFSNANLDNLLLKIITNNGLN